MKKVSQKFVGICFTLSLLLVNSCSKESGKITQLEWKVVNPVTGEGISGVPVYLYEHEEQIYYENSYHSSPADKNIIWMDTTDKNGKLRHTFYAKKNRNYHYAQGINGREFVENGDIIQLKDENVYIQKDQNNVFNYSILPKTEMVVHIQNMNCTGQNDQMRWRKKGVYGPQKYWGNWENYKYGCVNEYSNIDSVFMDKYVIEVDIQRSNGEHSYFIDTSYVDSFNTIDTLEIYY